MAESTFRIYLIGETGSNAYDSSNSSHQEVKGREITVKWKEEGMWTCKDPSCGKSNFDIQLECVRCKLKRHKWIRSQRCPEIKTATHTCHQCRHYQPLLIHMLQKYKALLKNFRLPIFHHSRKFLRQCAVNRKNGYIDWNFLNQAKRILNTSNY